ncbi:MAG TPA: PDZ domain-containing protein [Mollicutes bacterium]|nr:PDZ domain-containing protein [Mollicutes bacterium]
MTIKLPYYINTPGGSVDIRSKISIADHQITKNAFNMAYVYEIPATIPTLIYSYFNKNWDVIKKEEVVLPNENKEDVKFRDQMMLKEANQQAIILAYNKANKKTNIIRKNFYVTYIDELAKTDLKIGDKILKINNEEIDDLAQIHDLIKSFKANQKIDIQIKRDDKITTKSATIINNKNNLMIGILISVDQELETIPKIEFKFKGTEGGPSGGFMMSLAIYDTLTGSKLSQNRKIIGTGSIDQYGNVGEIGGVKYKIKGAVKADADIFFVPAGQNYEDVMEVKLEKKYDITVVPVNTLDDAIEYLQNN